MIKYLVVIGVIAFIYYVFIKKKPIKKPSKDKTEDTKTNEMVECSTCHIYCELDEAILSNGHYYCSDECLKAK